MAHSIARASALPALAAAALPACAAPPATDRAGAATGRRDGGGRGVAAGGSRLAAARADGGRLALHPSALDASHRLLGLHHGGGRKGSADAAARRRGGGVAPRAVRDRPRGAALPTRRRHRSSRPRRPRPCPWPGRPGRLEGNQPANRDGGGVHRGMLGRGPSGRWRRIAGRAALDVPAESDARLPDLSGGCSNARAEALAGAGRRGATCPRAAGRERHERADRPAARPPSARPPPPPESEAAARLRLLHALERKLLWLSAWMIHHANHIRPNRDGLKVGGHQASCASVVSIMAALYFEILRPQDRVAVKPHAGPVFHAINYLFGRQDREKLATLRAFGGIQPYPCRVKDGPEVDFSTGSVGLGVALTTFGALVQDYVRLHGLGRDGHARGPARRDRRRRRAGRGQHLRGPAGGLEARRPQCLVDRRLQPPEPRHRGAGPAVRPDRGPVPRHGLERRHPEIRPQAGGRLRAGGGRARCAAGSTTARTASTPR